MCRPEVLYFSLLGVFSSFYFVVQICPEKVKTRRFYQRLDAPPEKAGKPLCSLVQRVLSVRHRRILEMDQLTRGKPTAAERTLPIFTFVRSFFFRLFS